MWTVFAISLSTSFTGPSVEIQRTFMHRRRYVAPQEVSAPGQDGLPYSVYRLSTSSSRSNSARPSFSYGLGHMHGGSDSTNFSPSVFSQRTCCLHCGLHADLQLLRSVGFHLRHDETLVPLSRVDLSTFPSPTQPQPSIFPPFLRPHSSLPLTSP